MKEDYKKKIDNLKNYMTYLDKACNLPSIKSDKDGFLKKFKSMQREI